MTQEQLGQGNILRSQIAEYELAIKILNDEGSAPTYKLAEAMRFVYKADQEVYDNQEKVIIDLCHNMATYLEILKEGLQLKFDML